jgi:glyceraldehyde-3-phosphate dehydrogenase/erythrose-4-phosphate dehydrogenase
MAKKVITIGVFLLGMFVKGVNFDKYKKYNMAEVSNASYTTNCAVCGAIIEYYTIYT